MIFPSDTVSKLRGGLEDRISAGELSEADAYREALAADPDDPRALRLLSLLAEDEDDFATAGDLAWRWLSADPLSHEAFLLIGRLLSRDPAQSARAAAYRALGHEKLHFDPEAHRAAYVEPPEIVTAAETEPEEVRRELEPHRVLHAIWVIGADELDRALVDRALAGGADCVPVLIGVLNLYGEDLLDDIDDALVVRALALLGEIGDTRALPALARFLPLDDDSLSGSARWAFQRIALHRPEAVLEFIREAIPAAEPIEIGVLAQQVCLMPDAPERKETLLAMSGRVPDFSWEDRAIAAVAMIVSAHVMEGLDSPLAASIEQRYDADFTPQARRELKDLRSQLKDVAPLLQEPDETSIYDLCCTAFEPVEEDEPFVRPGPKIGRNDPCWCGSGKKYKKCHLEADEAR
jgi:hypothetical protein